MSPLTPQFLLLALGLLAGIQGAKVNSPTALTQCQPYAITWSEGKAPIYLSAVQGTATGSTPLIKFPTQTDAEGSYTWPAVNITAGTVITLVINDGSGQPNFSSQVTILDGSSDCLNGASATTPSTGSSSNTPATGGASTTPATGGGSTTPSTGASSSKPATTPSTSANSSNSSSTTTATNGTHSSTTGNATHTTGASTGGSTSTTSGSKGLASFINAVALGATATFAGLFLGSDLI